MNTLEIGLYSTPTKGKLIGKIPMTNYYIDENYNQWLALTINNKIIFQYSGSICRSIDTYLDKIN